MINVYCMGNQGGIRMIYQNLVHEEVIGEVSIVRLIFNEINRDQRDDLKNQMNHLLAGERKEFIIDLSKVGFLSSLVVATIIFFAKELALKGGRMNLFSTSNEPLAVLRITKLDKIFEVYSSEKEALQSFK